MRKIVITIAFMLVAHLSFAQDATFKADVLKVIEQSGGTGPMQVAKEQIMQNVPLTKRADFSKDFDASLPSLLDKIAAVYMEIYTHDEVKQMMKFYDSPIGKKISSSSGILYKKSTEAGQEWGVELQSILMKYMEQ